MSRSVDQVLRGLLADLPPGWAFRRDVDSTGAGLLRPLAAEISALGRSMYGLLEEADPRTAALMLLDWERAFGLPDECSAPLTLIAARRSALVARITERLSPTPASLIALAAAHGVRATIVEHRVHTCEDSCEDPICDEGWAYAFTMWSSGRVVLERSCEDDCEQPLQVWTTMPHECAVRRASPAHVVPLFGSFQDEWEFREGLPAGATFTRAGTASRLNARGQIEVMAADVPRLGYDPALTYNRVPMPWMDGLVAGDTASMPTGWSRVAPGGWVWQTAGFGVEDEIPYIDLRLYTPGTGNQNNASITIASAMPFLAGETWTAGVLLRLVAGDVAPFQTRIFIAGVGGGGLTVASPTTAPLREQLRTRSVTFATTPANQTMQLALFTPATGSSGDVTIRVGFPALNPGGGSVLAAPGVDALIPRLAGIPQYGLLGLMVDAAEGEDLRLAVPDGRYDADIVAADAAGVVGSYAAPGLISIGGSLAVQLPPAATGAGAIHLRNLILRKVA